MASGEGADQGSFKDLILDLGVKLLRDFIYRWIERHINSFTVTREQLEAPELHDPNHNKIAQCLQKIGDELDRNEQIKRIMKNPELSFSFKDFCDIVYELFKDGNFNWYRVAALFYLTSKLVIRAHEAGLLEKIKAIISWAIDYLRENLINWIREQGGWEAIYLSTPTWQAVGVFLAGFLTAIFVMLRM
ncbi:apoptosis regulator BAX [Nothobranchius furzeri]|uniref:Apoptosis regulator BAX-like n=3 Tax=Nothobranchius TaxID=28779 RepID=A0A8C6KTX6_NOTFU|nr:apoptosis regulator BAX [Nothobranchius furzeri]KAF7225774.1 apoptosis regulator BAX-like [Nothobranchius furzeri]